MSPGFWKACYAERGPYPISYAGTKAYDGDTDGDGVLDGADDQDFDDVPNIMELSRAAGRQHAAAGVLRKRGDALPPRRSRGGPTSTRSIRACRTGSRVPASGTRRSARAYAPFIPNFEPFVLN